MLLQAYMSQPEEEPLALAGTLGRELLVADIPLEEVVELHEQALSRMAQQSPDLTPIGCEPSGLRSVDGIVYGL